MFLPHPRLLPFILAAAALTTVALPGRAQAQAAADEKPMLFEAEFPRANGDVKVEKDPDALAGKYAMHPREYEPVFIHETPKKGNECVVWVRYRGTALQLKAVSETDEQSEIKWIFEKPDAWTWASLGVFPRKKLGKQIVIIRGPDAKPNAGLDAVIISTDAEFDPTKVKNPKDLEALRVSTE